MKKRILIFTSSIILTSTIITGYKDGPISMGQGNRTGSQGTVASCAGSGCHGANNSNTTINVSLTDTATNQIVLNNYVPGQTYECSVFGVNGSMPKYGLQLSAVRDSGAAEVQAGSFSNMPADVAVKQSGDLFIVEHTDKLPVTGFYSTTFLWTAPADTTIDTITFYAIVNAVNNDNSPLGDQPNNVVRSYARNTTTSVAQLNADIKINAYPNPMTDKLNISLENADNGVYSISVFDMHSKVVATQTANVNKSFTTSVNASSWAAGMYHVQLKKGDAQRTIAVVKQ
jgi:hypothetical protein